MSFAKLRSVPDPLAGLKADLDTARQHHARLEARLTAAHGEAGSASAAQRALLTNPTSEPGDVELGEAAARVGRANVAIDGIVGALDETRGRIEAIEAGISAEREATERAAEAARLDRAISAARATIAETAGAIEEFAQTFSRFGLEGRTAAEHASQVAAICIPAANSALRAAQVHRESILSGSAALPARAAAAPPAAPQAPVIERVRVFSLASPLKWREGDQVRTTGTYSQCDLRAELVARAVAHNLVDDMNSPRTKALMHRQLFALPPLADDPKLVDLDALGDDAATAQEV